MNLQGNYKRQPLCWFSRLICCPNTALFTPGAQSRGAGGRETSRFSRRKIYKHPVLWVRRFLARTKVFACRFTNTADNHWISSCFTSGHIVTQSEQRARHVSVWVPHRSLPPPRWISQLYSVTDSLSGPASSQTNRWISAVRSCHHIREVSWNWRFDRQNSGGFSARPGWNKSSKWLGITPAARLVRKKKCCFVAVFFCRGVPCWMQRKFMLRVSHYFWGEWWKRWEKKHSSHTRSYTWAGQKPCC